MAVSYTARQLQRKFKHAGDFGVIGPYNPGSAQRFREALDAHVADPANQVIQGVFGRGPGRGGFTATFYLNVGSRRVVVADGQGNFVTGFIVSASQAQNLLQSGKLGGGI